MRKPIKPAPDGLPKIFTIEHVAMCIGLHPESIRRSLRLGRIKGLKFGPHWRIPESELRRILEEGLPL